MARRSVGVDGSFGKIVRPSTSYSYEQTIKVNDIYQLTDDQCAPPNPCLQSKSLLLHRQSNAYQVDRICTVSGVSAPKGIEQTVFMMTTTMSVA